MAPPVTRPVTVRGLRTATTLSPSPPVAAADEASSTLVADDILGIVVHGVVDAWRGTESFHRTLLLEDGRARLGLRGSPLALELPAGIDRGADADGHWTLWRDAAEGYEIRDLVTGLWRRLEGRLFEPLPIDAVVRLTGTYERSWSRAGPNAIATGDERLSLALDGTFSHARSVLVSGGGIGGAGAPAQTSVFVAETADEAGRLGGSYALLEDGFTLELVYGDGTRERSLLLDDGGSRIIGDSRFGFTASRIGTIDLVAIVERWMRRRDEDTRDWRAVIAEASAGERERRIASPDERRDGSTTPPAEPTPRPGAIEASSPPRRDRS